MVVWCQQLEETEKGWGTRPDGYVLGLTKEDVDNFVKEILDKQEEYFSSKGISLPDEYTRPAGRPYRCEISETIESTKSFSSNIFPQPIPEDAKYEGWTNQRRN